MKTHEQLKAEIRYAVRLTQRTARLYRRGQSFGVFLSVLGGSGAMASMAGGVPPWLTIGGGLLLAIAGAALIAVRPADKAAANEADARRYQALMAKADDMTPEELAQALEEAHQGDAPEIEPLRAVAYNDVLAEINREDQLLPLSPTARVLKALA